MNRIRDLRNARNMNQDELGRILSVGKGAVSRYEKGKRQLDPDLICKLCDLFGCTADYLLGRSDNPLPAITDAEARMILAYRAASIRDRALMDQILAAYMQADEGKRLSS